MAILSLKRVSLAVMLGGVALYAGSQCWFAIRGDRQQLEPLDNDLTIISAMLLGIGGTLLWLSSRPKGVGKQSTDLRIFVAPGAGQQGAGYLRRRLRTPLISRLPTFGLISAFALLPVIVPVWHETFFKSPLQGIRVLTSGRSRWTPRYDHWTRPLLLSIDANKRWVFDGKPVSPEEFPAVLRQALSRRPDWFVCLDADRGLDYGVPVRAMDIIQGLSAKIIIATPKAVDDGCTSIFGR